jgi:rhomboid protease GluP
LERPGTGLSRTYFTRLFFQPEQLVRAIIYLNVGMYVLTLLLNPAFSSFSMNPLTFLAPRDMNLLLLGASGTLPIDRWHRWWTLLSANYLHGGLLHILFNMLAFKQIAWLINREYGTHRMFILYTLGGVFGFWVSYLAGVQFTIGASAAVCSLIGSAIYYGKSRGGLYGQAIYRQIGGWALGILAFGLIFPGINNWGHGGGFLAGLAGGAVLGYNEKKPENAWHRRIALVLAFLTAVILFYAVFTGIFYRSP